MVRLQDMHPDLFDKINRGLFTLRRSNNLCAGMFNDLCVEQVLMGSIKFVGGLTRGRGFDDSTSLVWLLSGPSYGKVIRAMQEKTGLSNAVSKAHKDCLIAIMK